MPVAKGRSRQYNRGGNSIGRRFITQYQRPGFQDVPAVMAVQSHLVEVIARFDPRIVKMADAGEKPED